MAADRRLIGRRWWACPCRRSGLAGVLLLAAAMIAGCTGLPAASTETPPQTRTAAPTAIETLTAAPTAIETLTAAPTDTPAGIETPTPSASPLPTVAGRVLRWASVSLPAALVASTDSPFQDALFGWSRGYLAFHENVDSGSAVPWTSADGRDWLQGRSLDMTGLSQGAQVEQVVEGPAGLLALGRAPGCADDGSGCMPEPATALWASTDGVSWIRVDLHKAFGGAAVGDVSAGPKGYMAVSRSSDAGAAVPAIWLSADGQNWRASSLPSATFGAAYLARGTVLGGGFLVAGRIGSLEGWGGGYFPSTTPAIWWSADGSEWSRVTLSDVASAPQAEATITKVADGKLVAHVVSWDCVCPPEGDGQAWTSTDGRTWKAATGQFPSPAVVLSDGHQALQVVSSDGALTVAASADGFRWAQVAVSGSGPADLLDEAYGPSGVLVEDSDGNLWLANMSDAGSS
ncbi:MAG: hypothetical protein ABSA21_01610 [Candidatus Limnocylindrales bacterium]|jgi:hypothetical protein